MPTIVDGEAKPDLSLAAVMKRLALALSMAALAAGCAVPAKNMVRIQAGM